MDKLRVPPHNIEAEQSVLGSMLLDRNAIADVTEILTGDEFYKESHRILYKTIEEIYNKDEPVDIITVIDLLKSRNLLEVVGGVSYISNIVASVPMTANAKSYAKIVKEKALLRRLIIASNEIMDKCYQEPDDVEEVLGLAEKAIFDISQNKSHNDFEPLSEIIMKSFDSIEHLSKTKGDVTGIPSGFTDLDRKTSGFQREILFLLQQDLLWVRRPLF
ncbi:DnaB-like helicase N-terminal domain-containing protein [Caloramator sp. Dgby_cultured_2]|uniref:DnaB-like helicase N-terminal domain-containing protein n=1 Tax=Caloramator sp. Dgby_cultured_2 TaxID=3029174 RepID=UPI00406CD331